MPGNAIWIGRIVFDLPQAPEDATAVIFRTGSGDRLTSRRCREITLAVLKKLV
jgi:hypothetical protein